MRVTLGLILSFGLVVAVALAAPQSAHAQIGNPVKPHIVFIVDVSGSMDTSTGFGSPSCTIGDTRINHAKCAIQDIVNALRWAGLMSDIRLSEEEIDAVAVYVSRLD